MHASILANGYSWTSWHRHTEASNKLSDSTQTPPSVPTMWPCGKHCMCFKPESHPRAGQVILSPCNSWAQHVLRTRGIKICFTQQTSVLLNYLHHTNHFLTTPKLKDKAIAFISNLMHSNNRV